MSENDKCARVSSVITELTVDLNARMPSPNKQKDLKRNFPHIFCWLSERLSTLLELCVHFSGKKLIIQTGLSRRRQSRWRLEREATLFIFLVPFPSDTNFYYRQHLKTTKKGFSLCARTQRKTFLADIFKSRGKLFVKIERDAKQLRGCLFIRLLPTRSDSECFSFLSSRTKAILIN